jgi:hypothetical protein
MNRLDIMKAWIAMQDARDISQPMQEAMWAAMILDATDEHDKLKRLQTNARNSNKKKRRKRKQPQPWHGVHMGFGSTNTGKRMARRAGGK